MAEESRIEPYEQLCHLADSQDIYSELIGLCRKADARYNGRPVRPFPKGDPDHAQLSG